jgi:hypothetical protein
MAEGKFSADDLSGLLDRLARGLEPIFGERYRGLALFGSYAFAARQTADYDTDFDLDRSQVHAFIEEGRNFPNTARDYLDREDTKEREPRPENG